MLEKIEDLIEVIENFSGWKKIIGISSIFGVILLFCFLFFLTQQPGGNDAVKIPSTIKDIEKNTTTTLVNTGIESSVTAGSQIITSFNKAGNDMASTVKDKLAAFEVIVLMTLAGFMLAGIVVLMIMSPIVEIVTKLSNILSF